MTTFADLGVSADFVAALEARGITSPFPVQELTIPDALAGRDVCGKAKTGSGKTLAFGLPVLETVAAATPRRPRALILVPTRELANQVEAVVKQLVGPYSTIKSALLIGGEPMPKQQAQLRMRPRIIVGTPGRIIDHLQRGSLMLHDAGFLVLDETDAALDEANSQKYGDMIENLAKQTQLMVVTHNRETMSRADIIYGVTLGSDDSSTLLSIRFEEAVKVAK
ncbi:MAG: DEAD/DEAH box helicase [Pseudomonadota bacterium]